MSREEEFRRNADECLARAGRAPNPLHKERWLRLAEHWVDMTLREQARQKATDDAPPTRPLTVPRLTPSRRYCGPMPMR
jgi:hypothetical protein